MSQWNVFIGALCYQFRMQVHRFAVWATFLGFAALVFAIAGQGNWTHWSGNNSPLDSFADWTVVVNLFIPPALGILLADRLNRERRLHVDELLNTFTGNIGARLLGTCLGSLSATLLPMFIIYSIGIGYICYHWQSVQGLAAVLHALPYALTLFLTVILPGALFIAAFSLAVPLFLWPPLYQFLFVCYWFWGNAFNPTRGIPSLSNTLLTPLGGYILAGFFGEDSGLIVHHATALQGFESLLLLIGIAVGVLMALWRYLVWQQVHS